MSLCLESLLHIKVMKKLTREILFYAQLRVNTRSYAIQRVIVNIAAKIFSK
jgi:hypothetical protein